MKKLMLSLLAIVAVAFCLLAFNVLETGGLRGRVSPINGAEKAIAISGRDTLMTDVTNGSFSFGNVKPATYTIWIQAKPPLRDASVENVAVIDSAITDVGEIKLLQ